MKLSPSIGSSDLTQAAREFAIRHAGKGVVVVISDFLDKRGYQDALRYLVARNMDIYVVHVLSQEEIDPTLVGDIRLVDCEDDDVAEITISAPLIKRYKQNLNAFVGGLKEWCTQRGITYIFTNNQYPFDKLILNYLRERGLVSNDELLPATVTPDDAHFLEAGPFLPTSDPSLWRLPSSTHFSSLAPRRSHKPQTGFAPVGARQKADGVPRGKTDGLSCLLRIEIGLAPE